MIKAIIFDCFGVIVGRGFDNTYKLAGGQPKKDYLFVNENLKRANLGQISEIEFNQVMAGKVGKSLSEWQANREKAEAKDTKLLGYICELKKHYKTAILSNSNKGVLSERIGDDLLKQCFDEVIVSAEVGLIKPDPKIYYLVAKKLKVDTNECVFIDDHMKFVKAATTVGMTGIHYKNLEDLKINLATIV
jgi:putative hydrolase of the HAD superfamily